MDARPTRFDAAETPREGSPGASSPNAPSAPRAARARARVVDEPRRFWFAFGEWLAAPAPEEPEFVLA